MGAHRRADRWREPGRGATRRESTARKRWPFTPAELRIVLEASPPEVRPKRHSVATALPWPVWLGAYTGARLNELCGLRVADVKEQDGILHLDLVDHRRWHSIPVKARLAGMMGHKRYLTWFPW